MITASDMGKKSWEVRKKKYGNSLMKRMSDLASKKRSEKAKLNKNEAILPLDIER